MNSYDRQRIGQTASLTGVISGVITAAFSGGNALGFLVSTFGVGLWTWKVLEELHDSKNKVSE